MRPSFHPRLVNGRFGDPAMFVEALHRRNALLFDMGDLAPLSARDLLRITHIFVSHTHIDHFIGFDTLLRICVGREKTIQLVGPAGFLDRVHHKLQGYEWDLVDRYEADLIFQVTEVLSSTSGRQARFRFKSGFHPEDRAKTSFQDGAVAVGEGFEVRAAILDHHGPCLGYVLSEKAHANVWRNRLDERGLPTGLWLQALKQAVLEGRPDDHPVELPGGCVVTLGELRDVVSISAGQKIAYVTDVADTLGNRTAICSLAAGADAFFIEARFAAADAEQARDRAHLTTTAAGEIAKAAGVRKLEAFHFSPRYEGEEERMLAEVKAAFQR